MDYEKNYKEALERARALRNEAIEKEYAVDYIKDYETIFPELAESEDERTRRWILEYLYDGLRKSDEQFKDQFKSAIAYLEKQKENPKSSDSIPEDCTPDAKCEDRWHKVTDSLPDNGREVLAKDKLGNTLLARYDGEGWDVSVYDDEDYRCHNGISKWREIPSEKQNEQKPVEIRIDNPNIQKFDPDVKVTTSDSSADGKELLYVSNKSYDIGFRDGVASVKPAEWSKGDEMMVKSIINVLKRFKHEHQGVPDMKIDWLQNKLKSLRPQPKQEWSKDYREEAIQTRFAFYTYKDDPGVLYLSNVFVEESSRSHGFGTRILKAAEKTAEAVGATTIRLKVKQDSSANDWYNKNGYSFIAFEDGYNWLEKNLEYMKPQPKQEWSEEDLQHKSWILECLADGERKMPEYAEDFRAAYNWLKSLPERFNLQPKQEQKERSHFVMQVLSDGHMKKAIEIYSDECDCKVGDIVKAIIRKTDMTQELMEHLEVLRMQTNRSYNTCENVYERSYYDGYASAIADLKRWIQKKMEAKEQTVGDVKL